MVLTGISLMMLSIFECAWLALPLSWRGLGPLQEASWDGRVNSVRMPGSPSRQRGNPSHVQREWGCAREI